MGDLTHDLGLAVPPGISPRAWSPVYRLTGRKTLPVRETPRTPDLELLLLGLDEFSYRKSLWRVRMTRVAAVMVVALGSGAGVFEGLGGA